MFLAICYEYLGMGRFTTEQRVFGFARAVLRAHGGDPEQIWAKHMQSYDAIRIGNGGVLNSGFVPGAANEENFGEENA